MKFWRAITGYAANVFASDADVRKAWSRAEVCAECPHLLVYAEDEVYETLPPGSRALWKAPPHSGWCGKCSCLVLAETPDPTPITVKGFPMEPAGKTTKENYDCPIEKW